MQLSQLPAKIAVAFANGGAKNPIPVPSQIGLVAGAASYTDGFPPLTRTPLAAGGVPPSGADMNGVLYEMSAVERWLCAGGQFKYDAAFSAAIGGYPKSSVLSSANSDVQWISTADNNTTNPDSTGAQDWAVLAAYGIVLVNGGTGGQTVLTASQYSKPIIILTGALTSNAVFIFPVNQPLARVINTTSGGFSVTCKTANGTGDVLDQGAHDVFFGDGTSLFSSRINTPPQFDASSRGASTAFVQRALGNFATTVTLLSSVTLTAAEAGQFFTLGNTGTLTLPTLASVPKGATFAVQSGTGAWTVATSGADRFAFSSTQAASIAIGNGDSLYIVSDGNFWRAVGGSAQLPFAPGFAQSLSGSGYKKLPGGFILQWVIGNVSSGQAVNLPIAFPNAMFCGVANVVNGAAWVLLSSQTAPQISHNVGGSQLVTLIAIGN